TGHTPGPPRTSTNLSGLAPVMTPRPSRTRAVGPTPENVTMSPRVRRDLLVPEWDPMARVLKPPAPLAWDERTPSVFLAGSIEMGAAADWQSAFARSLSDLDVVILNPRRDEWDASWVQSIDNPAFRGQVEWELEGMERASAVAMYFAPATRAPVT